MRNINRTIVIAMLFCAGFVLACCVRAESRTADEKRPSVRDLLRKHRAKQAKVTSPQSKERVVHFPKDRSLGRLYIQDATFVREVKYWFHWGDSAGSEYLGEAKGNIHVPAGKQLSLRVNKTAWRDMSWLSKLRPDDLYSLTLPALSTDPLKPSDGCMPHIAHLTGLKSLNLAMTGVTDRGLKYIRNLTSLEYLHLPDRATDRGLVYVVELRSLKGLYFGSIGGSQVTDAGLRHLTKLTSLEELYLRGERMGDAGLAYLRDLVRLKYLCLYGTHFTDDGLVHVKAIPSLRILSFHENLCRITDAGLVHISNLPKLEILCLHGMKSITDEGIVHLSKMRSLRKLHIGSSQVSDRGLGYLSQIMTLERLDLPQDQKGITDKGLAYLGGLKNLKHLAISRIHYIDPSLNKEYYTDKGLAELAKCQLLEDLSIGSIGITDAGIDHITKLGNLKRLNLFGCDNVTDMGLAKLTTLKSLRNLRVIHSNVSIAGLNGLKPMPNLTKLNVYPIKRDGVILDISGLTTLEEVNLSFSRKSGDAFTDADLLCLADLRRLKWLQIGPRHFTDAGIAYLAGLTNMERLGIGGPHLTDEGLSCLANMKKLDHLTISDGDFTDKGLRYLEGLKSLRFLNITSANAFSNPALQRLRTNLPNLYTLRVMP